MQKIKAYSGNESYIFVSYAHKDSAKILPLIKHLNDDGYRVWYDEGIECGQDWAKIIASHLAESACMIAFLTKNYLESDNCLNEMNFAKNHKIPIKIAYMEAVEIPLEFELNYGRFNAVLYHKYNNKDEFWEKIYNSQSLKTCKNTKEPNIQNTKEIDNTPVRTVSDSDKKITPYKHIKNTIIFLSIPCLIFILCYAFWGPELIENIISIIIFIFIIIFCIRSILGIDK